MNELELAQMKATYAEKMLRASVNQLDELSRAHADILDTLDDRLDKYAPHNRASVGTQLVAVQRILTDLIAELRGEHWRDSAGYCAVCENKTCCVSTVLKRAEARLREVTSDE